MPHAVESMFYVREVPWHGLGISVDDAPDSEHAIALAGLNWAVEQHPVHVHGKPISGYRANVRARDGAVLGIVGERYRVLQNREAFNFVDALLGHGVRYETAGSLHGGKRVWVLACLPQSVKVAKDEVRPYLCITNNHDGEGAVRVFVTPIRVVCQNTLSLALRQTKRAWSTRHIGSIASKMEEAARTLELTNQYIQALQEQADTLAQIKVPPSSFDDLIDAIVPVPTKAPETNLQQLAMQRAFERRAWLQTCLHAGDLRRFAGTAWAVVNAVIDYEDHTWGRGERSADNRFARVLDEGHPLVDKALEVIGVRNGR